MGRPTININDLNADERLSLIEELWDSLADRQDALMLTDPQCAELDRRVEEMDQDGTLGVPWDEVVRQIRERK